MNAADPIKIRSSRLDAWTDCPRRGSALMLREEIEAAGFPLRRLERVHVATVIGSAAHAGDAYLYHQLAETGEQGGLERVASAIELGIATFNEQAPSDQPASSLQRASEASRESATGPLYDRQGA